MQPLLNRQTIHDQYNNVNVKCRVYTTNYIFLPAVLRISAGSELDGTLGKEIGNSACEERYRANHYNT